jgi:gamma-glutamyltranspeptidase/glutathione hydrolase
VVHSTKGMAASTQPLVSAAGIKILGKGGNAAMAAVAMAAAIGVLEPQMTGLGGDAFGLLYEAKTRKVYGINGSGCAPRAGSIDLIRKEGVKGPRIPGSSVFSVTVPGAVAAWVDVVDKWGNGKLSLAEILEPAITLAEKGAPISSISRDMWDNGVSKLWELSPNGGELLVGGKRAPKEEEIFVNDSMANVLKRIAAHGRDGFYKGVTADQIVKVLKDRGGVMTHEDLQNHQSKFVDPVSIDMLDARLFELPPNNQGVVALIAMGIIKELDKNGVVALKSMKFNSVEYLHLIIETLKFAFKDAEEFVTDIDKLDYDVNDLLTKEYLSERAKLFDPKKVNNKFDHGVLNPSLKSDTSYFTASDSEGNACSFIASLYQSFGSGIVPKGCGFALQNRACNFNLTEGTRNAYEGGKRPYHTIIPAMVTNLADDSLYASYGVMGGFMQPQGHLQVFNNLKLFGFNAQTALDAPRICLYADENAHDSGLGADSPVSTSATIVGIEEGIPEEVVAGLKALGHKVRVFTGKGRQLFGRGQIIKATTTSNGQIVYSAGSDLRGDGSAIPLV